MVTSKSPEEARIPNGSALVEKRTPPGPTTRKHRRHKLCFTPKLHKRQTAMSSAFRRRIESLEASFEALAQSQREVEYSVVSSINDVKCTTKNELRFFVNRKVEALHDMIEKLNDKIVSLEKATGILSEENHSLKTQLGAMHSEVKKMKPPYLIHPCSGTLAAGHAAVPESPATGNVCRHEQTTAPIDSLSHQRQRQRYIDVSRHEQRTALIDSLSHQRRRHTQL